MRIHGFICALLISIAGSMLADGSVTVPANIAPTTWGIAEVRITAGLGGDSPAIRVTIYYFDAAPMLVRTDVVLVTNSEVVSLITAINNPAAGESGSQVKRFRQRITKWLVDNGKITNVTPE